MDIVSKLKCHLALTACSEIKEICQPLLKFGIVDFVYLKLYKKDGSMIDLSTNKIWSEFYFKNFYELKYTKDLINKHTHIVNNVAIDLWHLDPGNQMWIDAKNLFNIGNGITIEKDGEKYKELYYFAAKEGNYQINYFYLNNLELLEKFAFYFKDKASKFIKLYESDKLHTPREYLPNKELYKGETNSNVSEKNLKKIFTTEVSPKKYYLGGNFNDMYLSNREIECIKWIAKGKSAVEISQLLNISQRTVEAHIHNIKNKLNCFKSSELIYKITKVLPCFIYD